MKVISEAAYIPNILKNILDNYPAGSAVLREFLQNSDDAGARSQDFILDARTFSSAQLYDPGLESCQGPALLAVNDSHFLPKDWVAITTIMDSSKTADETSTGKYGLGFRSCYHITDNPQILSGKDLLILDPHRRIQSAPGGLSLDLGDSKDRCFLGHFSAFGSILQEDATNYNGTAIRLPLRLPPQAEISDIKKVPTSVDTIRNIFRDFIERELPEVMLFLKNITSIGLFEVGTDGVKRKIGRGWIDNPEAVVERRSRSRGREIETSHYDMTIQFKVGEATSRRSWLLTHFVEDYEVAKTVMSQRTHQDIDVVGKAMVADKLLPYVALALPLSDAELHTEKHYLQRGRLFTLLPLPIFTGFPAHLHSVLALTSSRQNLRNTQDVTAGSREQFLVEWNRAIFSDLAPKAWAAMLLRMAEKALDPLKAWPAILGTSDGGDPEYWAALPSALLRQAGPKPIWPNLRTDGTYQYLPLTKLLVAAPGTDAKVLEILTRCAVLVTLPAPPICALIQKSNDFVNRMLMPQTAYIELKSNVKLIRQLDASAVTALCHYLASANNINLISGIPVVPNVGGTYTTIDLRNKYRLVDAGEAILFKFVDAQLLAMESMTPRTCQLLLKPPTCIKRLQAVDVIEYLSRLYLKFNNTNSVTAEDVSWLVRFWNWVGGWKGSASLLQDRNLRNRLGGLKIVPFSSADDTNEIGQFKKAAVDPVGVDDALLQALRELHIPVLHANVESRGAIIRETIGSVNDVTFLLQQLPASTTIDLSHLSRLRLHEHLAARLSASGPNLSRTEVIALRELPVFTVLPPGARDVGSSSFGPYPAASYVVDDSVQVVPVINGITFIDATECRPLLSAIWKTLPKGKNTYGEKDVLELAIRNWAQQGQVSDLPDLLIDRIFRRLRDLSPNTQELLRSLPIVDVGQGHPKRGPTQVIDPKSSIAPLFDPEDGVLPRGTFAQDASSGYLTQLRNENMLQGVITMRVVEERIMRIVDFANPPREKGSKALILLQLLDDLYRKAGFPKDPPECVTSQPWLPVGDQMYSPSQCWDQRPSDRNLCDRVLPLVDIKLKSGELRRLFGWQTVPFDVLMRQFIAAVSSGRPSKGDHDRIDALIRQLAYDVAGNTCTEEDLTSLRQALGSNPWVPVSGGSCMPSHRTVLEDFEVTSRFYQVSRHLAADSVVSKFLAIMGVPNRPSTETLYEEITCISSELYQSGLTTDTKHLLIASAISILQVLSRRHSGSSLDHSRILVPCEAMTLEPFDTMIYNDIGDKLGDIPSEYKMAHPDVPPALARRLGLMRLSDDRFAEFEDQLESFQIGEALPIRIMGVLKDYDKEYASNEWVANADDAGAKKVAFVIDEVAIEGGSLLGPHLTELQRSPALVIHNDGVFSNKDFEGLGNIGKGGKTDSPESIGRFGLGAFSFYHFTELPMVVSASSVLFLDPSQSYLPRDRTGARRTGVKIPLDLCLMKYPGHLKPLDGLFNFTMDTSYYKGTLFRLPLRTPQQAKESKLSSSSFSVLDIARLTTKFYHLSTQSLFFSHLHTISAYRRGADANLAVMWSVTAAPKTLDVTEGTISIMDLSVQSEEPHDSHDERWLIAWEKKTLDDIPGSLQSLISPHRLPSPTVAIALKLTSSGDDGAPTESGESRLFATLPLPIPISLPVHVHATWILSRDRRSLRFDAPDARGEKPLDTQYNEFLLEKLAAPLYLSVIAIVASRHIGFYEACWPTDSADAISRTLSAALYAQFLTTEKNICITATKDVIPPSQAIFHTSASRSVQAILTALKISEFVNKLPFEKSAVDWHGLQVDDADNVARLLRAYASVVKRVFRTSLADTHLDGLLLFLLKGEVGLDGLPLLQLGDGDLVEFQKSSEGTVFASNRRSIADLFGPRMVLGNALKPSTIEPLLARGLNVVTFDANRLRWLAARRRHPIIPGLQMEISREEGEWLRSLLHSLYNDGTVALSAVSDLPLIPARNEGLAISLEMLENKANTITTSSLGSDEALIPALMGLGMVIAESLPGVPQKPRAFDFPYFLDAVASLGLPLHTLHQVPTMTEQAWHRLMGWIHMHLQTRIVNMLNAARSATLAELPIFEGRDGGSEGMITLRPASIVTMLPPGVDLDATGRYLPDSTVFAPFSIALSGVLAARSSQRLHHEGFFSRLRLPRALPQSNDEQFRRLLEIVITHHARPLEKAIIPDMNRVLRLPRSVYDHNIPLFAAVFADRPQALVNPAFRMYIEGMIQLGVRREVGMKELLACATVLDEDGRQGRPIRGRAELYWELFRDSDHTRRISYGSISTLRFIPTAAQRHLYVPEFGQFGRSLPDVVAPSEITTAEQSPILWTQRARFDEAPPDFLRAVMPDLGRPLVSEVVQHLVVLATQVAPTHHSHRNLLSDLSATYNWLSTNVKEAGEELLRLSGAALWLNVDNTVLDTWVWRAARELVFDLRWDDEVGRHYDANAFLLPFKPLLLASGAHEHRHPALPPAKSSDTQLTYHERVQAGFDELRETECLTDIHFNINGETIRAHRAILAAVVPHFMTVFRGEFKEGRVAASRAEPMVYDLSHATTSAFATRSVVDYAYTGSFKFPPCNNTEEAGPALANLLDLLDLSNLWDMDELKRKTQEVIVELKLVRLETCDEILTRAAACQALALVEVCQKTKEVNNWSR